MGGLHRWHRWKCHKIQVLAELDESAMATCAQERVEMIGKMMEKKHKRWIDSHFKVFCFCMKEKVDIWSQLKGVQRSSLRRTRQNWRKWLWRSRGILQNSSVVSYSNLSTVLFDFLILSRYNCFKEMFHSACQKSVKNQIYAFFQVNSKLFSLDWLPWNPRHRQWQLHQLILQQQVSQVFL